MDHNTRTVDIVIVGAGLSGLQAAYDVHKAGFTCVVLESMDRVGGKTWTKPCASGNGFVDVGAAWINDTTQPKMFALAKKYGLELVVQIAEGDEVMKDGNGTNYRYKAGTNPEVSNLMLEPCEYDLTSSQFELSKLEAIGTAKATLEDMAAKVDLHNPAQFPDLDNLSVRDFLDINCPDPFASGLISLYVTAMVGGDAAEVSMFFFLDYIKSGGSLEGLVGFDAGGAQYLRLRKGRFSSYTINKKLF